MPDSVFQSIRLWSPEMLRDTPWSGRLDFIAAERPRRNPGPLVLVVPGGGYSVNAPLEAHPVASWIAAQGLNAAVLSYRTGRHANPWALADLRRAIRVLRERAQDMRTDGAAIGLLGFSAGGHLAGLAGLCTGEQDVAEDDLADRVSARPDCLALVYPIVSFVQGAHAETRGAFLQHMADDHASRHRYSLENACGREALPPTLIVNGAADPVTPVETARILHARLAAGGAHVEMMEIADATHGFVLDPGAEGGRMRERLITWMVQNEGALA